MSKKHFIALADAVRRIEQRMEAGTLTFGESSDYMVGAREHHKMFVRALVDFCSDQNSRFDHHRWLAYIAGECGPNGGKR